MLQNQVYTIYTPPSPQNPKGSGGPSRHRAHRVLSVKVMGQRKSTGAAAVREQSCSLSCTLCNPD